MNFFPPQPEKLLELANAGKFPVPVKREIHVGSKDWQSCPNATAFGKLVGMTVSVVEGAGHRLPNKLHEQIQMAKAVQSGTEFVPVKIRSVKDEATGETRKVEMPKRLKPWWWSSDNGKMCITVRYGARTLEVVEGKNAIETENIAGVVTTLEVLRTAVDAGELDARIEAVSRLLKAGFDEKATSTKRGTLKLPAKAN